jgi:AsmA protein
MPLSTMKKGLLALAVGLAAVVVVIAALPFVASTQIVRDRIAHEMSAWSGYRVQLAEAPEIEVWPSFRAILRNVTLSEWNDRSAPPVVQAERVEIDLSAMAALRGDVVFSKARFVRPLLRLTAAEGEIYLPALPETGRMARAVEIGREAVAASPVKPDIGVLPDEAFGIVEFSGGRIVIAEDGIERELMTSLAGAASWPALNRGGTLAANGIWRGEAVALEMSSPQPLLLFAGGNAPLAVKLKSAPLEGAFAGSANFAQGFAEGGISLASPSLRRVLEWSRMHIAPGAAIGAMSLEAQLTGKGQRFNLRDTRLTVGGNPGIGALDLTLENGTPGISGTLAFETLDLRSFLSAFTPLPSAGSPGAAEVDTSFTDQIDLDLRLSANTATAGAITLSEVAATAQVKEGIAAFDISDARAFSGALQAGFRLDRKPEGSHAEITMMASDFDTAALAAAAGVQRFAPQGRATVSLLIKGPVTSWGSLLSTGTGSISAELQNATVVGLDLPAFLSRTAEAGFFPLSELAEGSLAVTRAELDATLSHGVARIDEAEAVTPGGMISLEGIVPYVGRGLALSGTVTPAGEGGEPTSFFVGGPWNAPFVSPILPERW